MVINDGSDMDGNAAIIEDGENDDNFIEDIEDSNDDDDDDEEDFDFWFDFQLDVHGWIVVWIVENRHGIIVNANAVIVVSAME